MRGQGLNDLPCCDLERRSSHHKGIFFEVPIDLSASGPHSRGDNNAAVVMAESIMSSLGLKLIIAWNAALATELPCMPSVTTAMKIQAKLSSTACH
jgi:hypothetical protein